MFRARRSAIASLAILGAAAVHPATAVSAEPGRLPNIVLIFTDDQGYADVGVFGAKGFRTPSLDRMASEGCRFTKMTGRGVRPPGYTGTP